MCNHLKEVTREMEGKISLNDVKNEENKIVTRADCLYWDCWKMELEFTEDLEKFHRV